MDNIQDEKAIWSLWKFGGSRTSSWTNQFVTGDEVFARYIYRYMREYYTHSTIELRLGSQVIERYDPPYKAPKRIIELLKDDLNVVVPIMWPESSKRIDDIVERNPFLQIFQDALRSGQIEFQDMNVLAIIELDRQLHFLDKDPKAEEMERIRYENINLKKELQAVNEKQQIQVSKIDQLKKKLFTIDATKKKLQTLANTILKELSDE